VSTFLIGENFGKAWRSMFTDKWRTAPASGLSLPESLGNGLNDVNDETWGQTPDPRHNGMKAWHAGSNAYLARKLGIIGLPLLFLGGIVHESPIDFSSFMAEQRNQGTVNHFLDSMGDIGANLFGMGVGYFNWSPGAVSSAIRWGNGIYGPADGDRTLTGPGAIVGPYNGNPSEAWNTEGR
jgi:hypothetical protein